MLGIPVRFECNSAHALQIIDRAYGWWRPLAHRPELIAAHRARVRVICHGDTLPEGDAFPLVSRMPDHDRLLIHTPGSLALADASRAEAIVYATPALLEAGDRFVSGVLDAVVLLLVTHFDRAPVHAALLHHDRSALLLSAPAGTGKSTLAYAALRAGYHVSADDVAYVQLQPVFRIWGATRALRVPVAARRWFPELDQLAPVIGPDGEAKLSVPLALDHAGRQVPERAVVCLVRRGDGMELGRLAPADLAPALSAGEMEPGFDRFAGRMASVVEQLSRGGGYCLTLGPDPRDALPYIERMLAQLESEP